MQCFRETVKTSQKKNAPCTMYKGSAAIDPANMHAYVSPAGSSEVYKYIIQKDMWIQLQNSLYRAFGLVVKDNYLLSVGGRTSTGDRIKKLFRLQGEEWKEHFPSMNTARSIPALAAQPHYLIVIGGHRQFCDPIASVEVLDDLRNTSWSVFGDLPHPLSNPSATLCGEQLYVLSGGLDGEGYCCSLRDLCTYSGSPPALTWTPIPQPPVCYSTIATLSGVPVLVGGRGTDSRKSTDSSSVYSLSHGQWVECGRLCEARYHCLVAGLTTSHNMLVVVGGFDSTISSSATVELCSVVV